MMLVRVAIVCAGLAAYGCSRSEAQPIEPAPTQPARPPTANQQVATLAGGCFWGMEELFRAQPGVLDTEVGYAGGTVANPTYDDVKTGASGHAEALRVVFDPSKTSYEKILFYFFKIHDPTTLNRQGNDVGSQYRSAIFVQNDEQLAVAKEVTDRVQSSGSWKGKITTQIVRGDFHPAESYHQDYLQKNPGGYTCHYERDVTF